MKHSNSRRAALLLLTVCGGCGLWAHAQVFAPTAVKRPDYTLKALAYVDPSRLSDPKHNPPSRYDLLLFQAPNTPYHWDFVLPGSSYARTQAFASIGSPDYRTRTQTTIRATLRQFDTYTEKVTFKDVDLAPPKPIAGTKITSRVLSIPMSRSITTPSGITVMLPAQSYDAIPPVIAGNPNVLFIRIQVTPNAKLVASLPRSPLFQKHPRPVSLQLGIPMLAYGKQEVYYFDNATRPYEFVAIQIPNLKTAMHLDQLTFWVRQRIDLQTVPVAIQVPISRPAPSKK